MHSSYYFHEFRNKYLQCLYNNVFICVSCHVKASMVKDEYTFVPDSYTISFKPNLNYLIRTTDGMVFHLVDNIKNRRYGISPWRSID